MTEYTRSVPDTDEKLYVLLLEAEIKALRSVLSEVAESPLDEYLQMNKANAASDMRNHLRRPQ